MGNGGVSIVWSFASTGSGSGSIRSTALTVTTSTGLLTEIAAPVLAGTAVGAFTKAAITDTAIPVNNPIGTTMARSLEYVTPSESPILGT